jgi:hypothetical protein
MLISPPPASDHSKCAWTKALVYCRQAGAKAMERSAWREAVGCYEQALAVLEHLPEHRTLPVLRHAHDGLAAHR